MLKWGLIWEISRHMMTEYYVSLGPCELSWLSGSRIKMVARDMLRKQLGRALRKGEVVRHKCDAGRCLRLDHLELGTQSDNLRDAVRRGRFGGARPKLSLQQREEISARYRFGGIMQKQLAVEYGVSKMTISRCCK